MKTIKYQPEYMRTAAASIGKLEGDMKYPADEIGGHVSGYSRGKVAEEIATINMLTGKAAEQCRLLAIKTGSFISAAADYLESQDAEIASKMGGG